MVSIYQVDPNKLIEKLSKELEGFNEIKAPEWAKFVKTGHSRERPPEDINWWYTRFAAVLRSIYKLGPIGVSKLRTKYGGRKNRGVKPEHFYKGSGNKKLSAQYTLYHSLLTIIKLIAPIMPFVTEEIYQTYYKKNEKQSSIHLERWPKDEKPKDSENFDLLIKILI